MGTLWLDIKYGIRMLRKNPGFTVMVILIVGLGIGANATMFSVANTVLLRPLPYPDSDRLVVVWESEPEKDRFHVPVSLPNFLDWQRESRSYEAMGLASYGEMNIAYNKGTCRIKGAAVSSGLFSTLGVNPVLGRSFSENEDQPGSDSAVILSHAFWQSQFDADPNVIGQTIVAEGGFITCIIVGVLPATFEPFDENYKDAECWLSLGHMELAFQQRGNRTSQVVAKLKLGVTLQQAQTEMERITGHMAEQYRENRGYSAMVVPLLNETVKDVDTTVWLLLAAVGFLLLIVCVNVANLLLTRLANRQREVAVRAALGAGPWRLVRQIFVESLVLAILGGIVGLLLATSGNKMLQLWLGGRIARMDDLALDGRVLVFTALVCLASCALFGLAPALRLLGCEVLPTLQRSAGRSASSRYRMLQDTLVVTQIALALVLLIGAGLLGRSFVSLMHADIGMKPENVLTFHVGLPAMQYQEKKTRGTFLSRLDAELQALPGVRSAGSTSQLPFMSWNNVGFWVTDGLPVQTGAETRARYQAVSPDYFKAVGSRLVQGRFFDQRDTETQNGKVIINETMARRFWPNQNPVGTQIDFGVQFGDDVPSSYEIVGIVGDAKQQTIQVDIQPEMWWLNTQHPAYNAMYTVRTEGESLSLIASIRGIISNLDQTVTISDICTLQERISGTLTRERFSLLLYSLFSTVALLLAALGVYGVMAYNVNLRQREIGIRVALGAQYCNVLGLILKKGCLLAGTGVLIGISGALAITRVMRSLLYQIEPFDPMTFALVPLLLVAVTLLSCYVPARRAAKIDPMEALRYE